MTVSGPLAPLVRYSASSVAPYVGSHMSAACPLGRRFAVIALAACAVGLAAWSPAAWAQEPVPAGCTIIGTAGNDNLMGTKAAADVICGLGGDDTITALAGNDTLIGGSGNDHLLGGQGNDTIDGGPGTDIVSHYDSGISRVTVALTCDYALDYMADPGLCTAGFATGGGAGEDTFVADGGFSSVENINGSPGSDYLVGDARANNISGRQGDDTLYAGAGDDTLVGSAGVDVLHGQGGNDAMQPGPVLLNGRAESVDGGETGETGFGDTIKYNDAPAGVSVHMQGTYGGFGWADSAGRQIADIMGVESITGSAFNDTLSMHNDTFEYEANLLNGIKGDDDLTIGDEDSWDTINGGLDNDTCTTFDPISQWPRTPSDTIMNCESGTV